MPKGAFIKVDGSLKEIKHIYTKVNGSIKEIQKGWIRVGGEMKLFFTKDEYVYEITKFLSVEGGGSESDYTGVVGSYVAEWQDDGSLLMRINISRLPTTQQNSRPCVRIRVMKSDGSNFTGDETVSISTYSENIDYSYNHVRCFSIVNRSTPGYEGDGYEYGASLSGGVDDTSFHPYTGSYAIEVQLIVGSSQTYYGSCRIDLLKINDTTLIPGMFH